MPDIKKLAKQAALIDGLASGPVVYYLTWEGEPELVKIGTTSSLKARLTDHRRGRPLTLLAVEPGHFRLEALRHVQFGHARVNQREMFYLTDDLRRHIDRLRGRLKESGVRLDAQSKGQLPVVPGDPGGARSFSRGRRLVPVPGNHAGDRSLVDVEAAYAATRSAEDEEEPCGLDIDISADIAATRAAKAGQVRTEGSSAEAVAAETFYPSDF